MASILGRRPAAPAPGTPPHRRQPAPPARGGASGTPPTLPFDEAIRQYQGQHPATAASYEGLFPYLTDLGYQVERPTHAGGTLQSDDKIVDSRTGQVYDLFIDSDRTRNGGTAAWTLGTSGYWVNGRPTSTPPGAPAAPPGAAANRAPAAGLPGERAVPRGTFGAPPYPAAYEAARRQRQQAGVGGRRSTILGGFRAGTPQTRPTLLGRA